MLRQFVLSLCVGLGLVACSGIPTEEVQTYTTAYTEAQAAGTLLLDKISPTLAPRGGKSKCKQRATGITSCFDADLAIHGDQILEADSIRVRRAALDAIATYNALLLAYAENRSADVAKSQLNGLGLLLSDLQSLIPGSGIPFGTITDQLGGFVARIEQARASRNLRQVLIDGKPIIQDILAALIEDTDEIYTIYYGPRRKRQVQLAIIVKRGGEGAKVAVQQREAITRDLRQFHDSVTSYARLLHRTSKALDVLADAAENPQLSEENLRAVIRESIEIRNEARIFWRTIRGQG
ncbi:hypothetical protein [Coralliovum pocilloporae]|uniref:hypothetical protein n=1 Tax=Coralliovum pocilloporae TaxID=3066369 RepID=UPI003306A63F